MSIESTRNTNLEETEIEQDLNFDATDLVSIEVELPDTDTAPRPVVACETFHP